MLNTSTSASKKQRGFGHGGLRLVVLKLIAEQPRHGYEVITAIDHLTAGHYRPSAGMVYPLLTQLLTQGFIQNDSASSADCKTIKYAITATGERALHDDADRVDAIFYRAQQRAKQPDQVIRAIENFKCAMRHKLSNHTLNPEQAHDFAAILDSAVQQIERL
jgi:DNA-binding PadR family transcriptional regulator